MKPKTMLAALLSSSSLGLLPSEDDDGVDEMSAHDVGTLAGTGGSDLSDCLAFEQMALARRGRASNERTLTLDSSPPSAELSESFFKATGPKVLLGYNYYTPLDASRAPERIMRSWLALRRTMGDADAWMKANNNRNGHNVCTIQRIDDSHIRYGYFKREKGFFYNSYFPTNVIERIPR